MPDLANTEDTVNFGRNVDLVEVLVLSGSDPVYFTVDGSAATVAGARTRIVASGSAVQIGAPDNVNTTVRLISASAATYSVSDVS